jgi:hypothetical protein
MTDKEPEEIGFHKTKAGMVGIQDPFYCVTSLQNLTEKVSDLASEIADDRNERNKLTTDVKLLEQKTENCTEEKKDFSDRISEVETQVSNIEVARETAAKGKSEAVRKGSDSRKFWISVLGIAAVIIIALGGLGLFGSARSKRLEAQFDILLNSNIQHKSAKKSEQDYQKEILDNYTEILKRLDH